MSGRLVLCFCRFNIKCLSVMILCKGVILGVDFICEWYIFSFFFGFLGGNV